MGSVMSRLMKIAQVSKRIPIVFHMSRTPREAPTVPRARYSHRTTGCGTRVAGCGMPARGLIDVVGSFLWTGETLATTQDAAEECPVRRG